MYFVAISCCQLYILYCNCEVVIEKPYCSKLMNSHFDMTLMVANDPEILYTL